MVEICFVHRCSDESIDEELVKCFCLGMMCATVLVQDRAVRRPVLRQTWTMEGNDGVRSCVHRTSSTWA